MKSLMGSMVLAAIILCGCKLPAEQKALRKELIQRLQVFAALKEKHAESLIKLNGDEFHPEFREFFKAAKMGEARKVMSMYRNFRTRHSHFGADGDLPHTPYWSTVLETCIAYDLVTSGEPRFVQMAATELMSSIPKECVFFGGSDIGRGFPTAFSSNHVAGIPFITLTQNALADETYLHYARATYGKTLRIPTDEDSWKAFSDYVGDAKARFERGELKSGENVKLEDGEISVQGLMAVMEVNARLAKSIFDNNPERKFFIEQSYRLDWTYPHLLPEGVVLRINRNPLATIPDELVALDRQYWEERVSKFLSDSFTEKTSPEELAALIETVYVRRKFLDFRGDREFIASKWAQWAFSRWRASSADVYAWRARNAKSNEEKARMTKAADFAYRQAVAIGPSNTGAVFGYALVLAENGCESEALLIIRAAGKLAPANTQFGEWIRWLEDRE